MSRVEGADEMLADLKRLGDEMPDVKKAMIRAGGQEMAQGWHDYIEKLGYHDTFDMDKGISVRIKKKYGLIMAFITSEGTDRHGVRNAAKAFYLHYGTSQIKGSHWIDNVEREYAPRAAAVMRDILNDAINKTIGAGRSADSQRRISQALDRQARNNYFIDPYSQEYRSQYKRQHRSKK